ncbi:MAG: phosphate signaling complex protein PhoU [Alphaproteobacteria bacterium]
MNSGNLIRKEEARDFNHLFQLLEKMDKVATDMVDKFIGQLHKPNRGVLKKIIAADISLDELEIMVNEDVITIISRWQPVASDLRLMIAAIKIATAFERIGDYIYSNSQKLMFALDNGLEAKSIDAKTLGDLGDRVMGLMALVSSDIKHRTCDNAEKIMAEDSLVDEIYGKLYQKSLKAREDKSTAGLITTVMIAKYFERIGDQLSNIAEALLYAIRGKTPTPERQ